jgi:hypothetical protein
VLAVLLYLFLGPKAALAELGAELLICVALLGGGGGGRLIRVLREWLPRRRGRARLSDAPT